MHFLLLGVAEGIGLLARDHAILVGVNLGKLRLHSDQPWQGQGSRSAPLRLLRSENASYPLSYKGAWPCFGHDEACLCCD